MSNLTSSLTSSNIDFVRSQIERKNNLSTPAYPTYCSVSHAVTDMDHFPYQRFYRGEITSSEPIVMEREAGFREIKNYAYNPNILLQPGPKPEICFQPPCSTIYPCNSRDLEKI